jgi:hypothetical protein
MSASREHGHGRGLEPEDVDRLFPDPGGSTRVNSFGVERIEFDHVIDYKRRAAGERDEPESCMGHLSRAESEPEPAGDEDQQPPSIQPGPGFEDEPWPDPPIDGSAELEEDPAGPKLKLEASKIADPINPIGYPQHTIWRLAPTPSSKTWFMELEKILE